MALVALALSDEDRRRRLEMAAERMGGKALLGRALGYKDGAFVGQMIRGERPITEKTLAALLDIAKVSDLFSFVAGQPNGFAPGFRTAENDERAPVGPAEPFLPGFEPLSVPVLATAAAMGPGFEQHDDIVVGRLTLSPQWVQKTLKPSKLENLRFIHGYGDSMEGTFNDGDILLVDAGIRNADIDGVYVLEANNRIFVKRVTERFDGRHEITSDNPKVKTVQLLDGSQAVSILGRVIWAWNGKKL